MAEETERAMPLWEHLSELRGRLVWCLLTIAFGFAVTYGFSEPIIHFLELPLLKALPAGQQYLYFTGIADKFMVYVQVSLVTAITLTSPILLYQIWKFIEPALLPTERRFAIPFVGFATFSFLVGLVFAYYLVLPYGYAFLVNFGGQEIRPMITLQDYFSLTLKLLLGVALIFETPVILLMLAKIGLIDADFLKTRRSMALILAAVVSAVITPSPDAFTMVLVMVPLYLLYELSIFLISWTQ